MPKISAGSLAEHRARTRERVFAAFAALMDERGYNAISLADIAARAGIGRTALYNHFPDKEAVVLAFAMDETADYVARLEAALADVDDPTSALRTYIRTQLTLAQELHLGFGPELSAVLSPGARQEMRQHVRVVEDVLSRILTDGMAAGDFTPADLRTVLSLVHSCLQSRHVPTTPGPDHDRAIATTEAFVLRALGAATAPD